MSAAEPCICGQHFVSSKLYLASGKGCACDSAAAALAAVPANGLSHGDSKAEILLVVLASEAARVTLIDFGLLDMTL